MTVVVCEGGVLVLGASGRLEIWRDGKMSPGLEMPGLPEFPKLNHWHAWVDNCLGKKTELRTPFRDALRITEIRYFDSPRSLLTALEDQPTSGGPTTR